MKNIDIVLNRWATKAVDMMKATLKTKGHVASGSLINSIGYEIKSNSVEITMNKYGQAIESGRKPAFIPIKPLVQWIIRKNIPLKKSGVSAKQARSKKGKIAQKEALGMAFAISRAAKARSGPKGLYTTGRIDPFAKQAMAKTFKSKAFEKEIRQAARDDIREMLKNNK